MKKIYYPATCLAIYLIGLSCNQKSENQIMRSQMFNKVAMNVPVPEREPQTLSIHGDDRVDNYYWFRLTDDQKNAANPDEHTQKVLKALNAENSYLKSVLSHTEKFQEKLYNEIVGRIKQTDMSVPFKENGYYYLTRYEQGKEHPIYSRKEGDLNAKEEIMIDANITADKYAYYRIAGRSVSPNNRLLAFGEDTLSRRIYTIKVKDLKTNEMLNDQMEGTSGGAVWANDNKTIFYTKKDPLTLRSSQIYRHVLGTDQSEDELVFNEVDDTFSCYVRKTKSDKYIVIGSSHTLTNEYQIIKADDPFGKMFTFEPRDKEGNLEYSIDHFENKWYIRTNYQAKNFRLMMCLENATGRSAWQEVIPHREDVLLEDMEIFKNFLVLTERLEGITDLRVIPNEGDEHYIELPEKAHMVYTSVNRQFDTEILRFGYQSMTTPNTIYDYNMRTREKEMLKQEEVVGDFDPSDYRSERIMATARDGERVPISLVYHRSTKLEGSAPCLLYGYGSYGASMDPSFRSNRLSLLDRGFVFAIAHIRGGEEMGRKWYENGKLLNKKNTFFDFIDCGEFLIEKGYADKDRLFAMGGSAGGLLMGAVINYKPDLWKGVVAGVPFVDVITTMLDHTIPLTTFEFDEWGDPSVKVYYDYMKSYSPYDNVQAKEYPALLVTTGLFDSQVQYWEPAKWVAKLRELKTDENPLLLYCNMDTGHGGAAGRFERHKETAMEYAFLLDLAGLAEKEHKG